jgi:hypothetical protein
MEWVLETLAIAGYSEKSHRGLEARVSVALGSDLY